MENDCSEVVRSCKEVIKQADKAVRESKEALDQANRAISQISKDNEDLTKKLTDAKEETKRWYHNPAVNVPIGGALALGAVVNPAIFIAVPVILIIGIFN